MKVISEYGLFEDIRNKLFNDWVKFGAFLFGIKLKKLEREKEW